MLQTFSGSFGGSFAPLRISPARSDARTTGQLRLRALPRGLGRGVPAALRSRMTDAKGLTSTHTLQTTGENFCGEAKKKTSPGASPLIRRSPTKLLIRLEFEFPA